MMSARPESLDAAMLARLQALEIDALTDVYDQYYTPLYRYITFRVSDEATAEDLANEVFARLLAALRRRQPPHSTVKGWLFGVADRVVADHHRKQSRWRWHWLSDDVPSTAELPEHVAAQTLRSDRLRASLRKLNAEQQHVLALRFGYGMAIAEVAALLGKSEGAVKMLQARAVARLSEDMADA